MGVKLLGRRADDTSMIKTLTMMPRWGRPTTTLPSSAAAAHTGVCPPSLRCAPGNAWQRFVFWLLAPAPQEAAPPLNRLPAVRRDFAATLADIDSPLADRLRLRIDDARSLRELWHVRAEVYRVVGVAHSQQQAEARVALLNRHFPTRSPRSQFVPL